MKKLLIFVLLVVTCLSLAACGGDSEKEAVDIIGGADGPTAVFVATPAIEDAPQNAYGGNEMAGAEAAPPLK